MKRKQRAKLLAKRQKHIQEQKARREAGDQSAPRRSRKQPRKPR